MTGRANCFAMRLSRVINKRIKGAGYFPDSRHFVHWVTVFGAGYEVETANNGYAAFEILRF